MLVLTRSIGQRIILKTSDGDVIVSVQDVRRQLVRVGITAPRTMKIYREEVLAQIEGEEASRAKEAQENQATPSP